MSESDNAWDPISLNLIGRQDGEQPLVEEVDKVLTRASRELQNVKAKGNATITVTITLSRHGEGDTALLMHHDVAYSGPKVRRKPMTVWRRPDGVLVTQDHKQMPLTNVTPINLNAQKE